MANRHKYRISVLAAVMLIAALIGCDTRQADVQAPDAQPQTTPAATQTTAAPTVTPSMETDKTPILESVPDLGDGSVMSAAKALLIDPVIIYQEKIEGFLESDGEPCSISDHGDFITADLETNFAGMLTQAFVDYDGRGQYGRDTMRQCIVLRYRPRINWRYGWRLDPCTPEGQSSPIFISLKDPQFPSMGIESEAANGESYFGFTYDLSGFEYRDDVWYCMLIAIDKDAEFRFAMWQEDDPANKAYYAADLAEEFKTGTLCKDTPWRLWLMIFGAQGPSGIDFDQFYIIDYQGYVG